MVAGANSGELELPDFQRGWIWDDDRKSMLARVSAFSLIGAAMLLQRIEGATHKSTTCEAELFGARVVAESYDEGPTEWDTEEPLKAAAS